MRKFTLLLFLVSVFSLTFAQTDTTENKKIKKGFSFGAIPVVAYNTDTGFKYGGLVNLYHFGDGTNYPNYNHSLYFEWSRTTKGSGITQAIYDTRTLIPNTRMTVEAGYFTEQALDFYGFNGYQTYFNNDFQDDLLVGSGYISRVYYRHARELLRLKADFQGNIIEGKLKWLAGIGFDGNTISTVDIAKLNEGKTAEEMLPDTATLFDKYVEWGIIKDDQKEGGNITTLKLGLVYDTRDNEANPNSGIWSEVIYLMAPGFLGNDYAYSRINFTHRQYFTLVPKRLTFAYRLSYESKISGETPFYALPFFVDSKQNQDGLGGGKNLRGIMRNRVVGDGFALGNFEFRWKVINTVIFNQNFYIGLNAFADLGIVTNSYAVDLSGVTASYGNTIEQNRALLQYSEEGVHLGYGGGIRFALNDNFIIAVDYGLAAKAQDGENGLYIGLNYIF